MGESKEQLVDPRSTEDDSDTSDLNDSDVTIDDHGPYTDDPLKGTESATKEELSSKSLAWLAQQRKQEGWQKYLPSRPCLVLSLLITFSSALYLTVAGWWAHKAAAPNYGESEPWYPSPKGGTLSGWNDAYEKATTLVNQMTLVEKVNITTGIGWSMGMCVGNTGPVDRLGFPSLCLQDGPLGLRFVGDATVWPAGITVGATWNKDLMYQRGKAHGFEAKKKGINILLGPSMGPLGRLPAGGRNWEGFGSDPVLQGIAAAQSTRGIQSEGVMATAKHYVGNEQEHFRQALEWGTDNAISSNIDDRTLHEVYAWPFAESVRAGVASVMCSYNQVNNSDACQNSKLLNGVLKDELGFQGFVMADWLAQRSGVASALAGLDMTMPGDGLHWADGKSLWGSELTKAVLNTSVPMERLNDMTLRIVAAWYQLDQDSKDEWPAVSDGGGPNFSSWTNDKVGQLHPGSPDSSEKGTVNKFIPVRDTAEGGDHDALARKIAAEGIVLVKNEGDILPLSRDAEGWRLKSGAGKIKLGIFGEDAFPNSDGINSCEDRACNKGTLTQGWGSGAAELPYLIDPMSALIANLNIERYAIDLWPENNVRGVQRKAAEQDICFVFINSDAGEGFLAWEEIKGDRNDLYPQEGGDELVQRVASTCENTIVVLHTVGPTIVERWIDMPGVKAVLMAHLPGQESGNALADVIFGTVNPSGRLPYTIAKAEDDYGPTSKILYHANSIVPQQNFTEGLYIDYRYFDEHDISPRYEFGYGLSYTTFKLNNLVVESSRLLGSEPKPRPNLLEPPKLDNDLPPPESAIWPLGFRSLKKYVYPYMDSATDIKQQPYEYPEGYHVLRPLSKAGGGEGGNPDLYKVAVTVKALLTNSGAREGQCVVQLYVEFPSNSKDEDGRAIDMPIRVLRNFEKLRVTENSSRAEVSMDLTRKDLSYWDVKKQNWIMPQGKFRLHLGFSSRDLPLTADFSV